VFLQQPSDFGEYSRDRNGWLYDVVDYPKVETPFAALVQESQVRWPDAEIGHNRFLANATWSMTTPLPRF